jgi:hypothetical protein
MDESMKSKVRQFVIGSIGVLALGVGLLTGGSAASAADGTVNCGSVKFLTTFSYTAPNASQPNSHRHEKVGGSGSVTYTKWEGGNYTTSAGYHYDRYTLAGSNKSYWCEV